MNIQFEKTTYFLSITKENPSFLEDNQKNLKFRYGNITFKKYHQGLDNSLAKELFIKRVCKHLSLALWTGTIQAIYHLGKAVLIGISKNSKDALKAQMFSAARSEQEAFGHIFSLLNPKHGKFHIEEARFHKTYYKSFFEKNSLHQEKKDINLNSSSHVQKEEVVDWFNEKFKEIQASNDLTDIKDIRYELLAKESLQKKEKENALKATDEIVFDSEKKEELFIQLAESYLQDGDKERANEVIQKIIFDTEEKGNFLAKLADEYLQMGNRGKALGIINQIYYKHEAKEAFLEKLAGVYFQEGDKKAAFDVSTQIHSERKEKILAKLAQSYFDEKVEHSLKEVLCEVVSNASCTQLLTDPRFEVNGINQTVLAFSKITNNCYDNEVKRAFQEKRSLDALRLVKEKALKKENYELHFQSSQK